MVVKLRDLLRCIFLIGLFQGIFQSYLHFSFIIYLCDIFVIIALIMFIFDKNKTNRKLGILKVPLIAFTIIVIAGIIINMPNLLQVFWGIRNYYRFFVYFILCYYCFKKEDVQWALTIYEQSFWINMILVFFQYFVQGYKQDLLGGICGTEAGCNGGLNIYLIGMVSIIFVKYYNKQMSINKFFVYISGILINAALSELKFFFIEIVILTIIYFLITRAKMRKIGIVLVIIIMLPLSNNILIKLFPNYENFFTINSLLNTGENYASGNDIGRMSVFEKLTPIIKNWSNSKFCTWIGIGIGNADYSSTFPFLNSAFFEWYSYLHYTWLSLGYLFVENGYLGIITYISFFIMIFGISIYKYRKKRENNYLFTVIFSFGCLMNIIYNSSLRSNYAYTVFILLSVPFVNPIDNLFKNKKSIREYLR